MDYRRLKQWLAVLLLLLPTQLMAFGNEYVHIKVHVPKDRAPSIALNAEVPNPSHNVIHHFHHHAPPKQRARLRPEPKLKNSPLLESVILSDLDKPSHMNEHAEYLNHAKELAEHLSVSYAAKKPPPPPPPKKKVNTYTIIEEKHRANGYEHNARPEHGVDTFRVIDTRPQHYHSHSYQQDSGEKDGDDTGYQYAAPGRHHRHKTTSPASYHSGNYAEPAPVEEATDADEGYNYMPPIYSNTKSARSTEHALDSPQESYVDSSYQYEYGVDSGSSGSGFRPSPQLYTHSDSYGNAQQTFASPLPTRHRRPNPIEWPSHSVGDSYNSVAEDTYNDVDSYNVGRIKRIGSDGYRYSSPYL